MNTDDTYDTNDKDAHLRLLFLLYINHVYMIMWLFGAIAELVATQWLKDDSIKANRSKSVSSFEPHEPHVIFVEYYMYVRTLVLLFQLFR